MIPHRLTRFYAVALCLSLFFYDAVAQTVTCSVSGSTIWVTTANDDGIGSLRQAIICANLIEGANTIKFNIPGNGNHVIQVGRQTGQPLPAILDTRTVIDATTQSGYSANNPRIILDGSQVNWTVPINAITVLSNRCEIYGLEIRNFPDDGIEVYGANNVIIGAPNKGNVIYNCGIEQDYFPGTTPTGPWNGCGIVIRDGSSNCKVQSNIIGTNRNLTNTQGNEFCGIILRANAHNNLIGGALPAEGNTIAYNEVGVWIESSQNVSVLNNSIYCNSQDGILLRNGGNFNKQPPLITFASTDEIIGKANPGDQIEVFINNSTGCNGAPCQGKKLVGRVIAFDSTWTVPVPQNVTLQAGDVVTATATNLQNNTSPFSGCRVVVEGGTPCAAANGVITVTNTNDDGPGSLRAAIECANNSTGANTIRFNIPGNGRKTIFVGSSTGQSLPTLTDARTIIDGTTQAGFGNGGNYNPRIILDGSQHDWNRPENALWIQGNRCEIYGLEIRNFPDDGIDITGASNVRIGAPNKGNVIYNCGSERDIFPGVDPPGPWEGCGIVMRLGSQNTIIQGNIIGTNYDRTVRTGNEYCGIVTQNGDDNITIGGTTAAEGNVIAYNSAGIRLSSGSQNVLIRRNSFICNDTLAIGLLGTANNQKAAPVITNASAERISGTAAPGDIVEVYRVNSAECEGSVCQGSIYLGTATANNNGRWQLNAPYASEFPAAAIVTATATAANNTSAFAACVGSEQNTTDCSQISATITTVLRETCDQNNGSFTVSVQQGTPPYLYTIGGTPQSSATFSNLNEGTYAVTVTDANGCKATQAVAINASSGPSLLILDQVNATCGQSSGSFSVLAFGGVAPYAFDIGDGVQETPAFNGLSPGTYTVTVTDATGCSSNIQVTIQNTQSIGLTISNVQDATCGEQNGSFTAALTGGVAPIVFNYGSGQTSNPVFSNLAPGSYIVTATDANGCIATHGVTINATPALTLTIENAKNSDCGQQNGEIRVNSSGGTTPIIYNIGNGPTQNSRFSNLAVGTYTITATDVLGCTDTKTVTIDAVGNLNVTIQDLEDAACGQNVGAFRAVVNGGTAPITYNIGTGAQSSPIFNNLAPGNYTVVALDAQGCSASHALTINTTPAVSVAVANVVNADCGEQNGSFSIQATGGTAPLIFNLGNGNTQNTTFSDLATGSYTITVTDIVGCTATATAVVESNGTFQVTIPGISDATCGQNNGAAAIVIKGGTAPYEFKYTGGTTDQPLIENLSPGTYTLTVTDANGCVGTEDFTINSTPELELQVQNSSNTICSGNTGSFQLTAVGGTSPIVFDIGNGPTQNPQFNNLAAGTYTVTATDAVGCTTTKQIVIETEGGGIELAVTLNLAASCELTNGAFTVAATGGNGIITYALGNTTNTTGTFTNLSPGQYTVTATAADGCSKTQQVTIQQLAPPVAHIESIEDAICGQATGSFKASVEGGKAPYFYSIGGGVSLNPSFTNLLPGDYTVTVTDADGCTAAHGVTIQTTPVPRINVLETVDADCQDNNGAFTISIEGGIEPFTFNIGNGATTDTVYSNLPPGTYTVSVTDALGCTDNQSVTIEAATEITISVVEQQNTSCGEQNGMFRIVADGGQAPYSYNIGNGNVTTTEFNGLAPGSYTITITDANGCTNTRTIVLENSIALSAAIKNVVDVACGQSNGSFTVEPSGGNAPYKYDIGNGLTSTPTFNNLTVGTYTVTVTDNSGCTTTEEVSIEQNGEGPTASTTNEIDAGCSNRAGSFRVLASGGTAPYQYDIGQGPGPNPTFTGLAAGSYVATVTDANGCTTTTRAIIFAGSPMDVYSIGGDAPICNQPSGRIVVAATNGTPPYQFTIGNGQQPDGEFKNLAAGTYTITATDSQGCRDTLSITLTDAATAPSLRFTTLFSTVCGEDNGEIRVEATGGLSPYSYNIGTGNQDSPIFPNLSAGNYSVIVTDANGCQDTVNTEIAGSTGLSVSTTDVQNAACGDNTGAFTVAVTGGLAPYFFNIGTGPTQNATFSDLAPGTYTVTVTDNICTAEHSVRVGSAGDITASVGDVTQPTCAQSNGSITVIVNGGTIPYKFDIGNGPQNLNVFSNLEAGTHTVTVTDSKNCSFIVEVELESANAPPVAAFEFDSTQLTVQLTNTSTNATSISWNFGDGSSPSSQPTVNHAFNNYGSYTICLTATNECGTDTYCEDIEFTEVVAKANISGTIVLPDGRPISDVVVSCSGVAPITTGENGKFQFEDLSKGQNYTIVPRKNINVLNGVTTYDLFLVNNHILGRILLDSPYKIIAADVNNSGGVSTADLVSIQRLILGIDSIFSNSESWRFIAAEHQFSNPENPFVPAIPAQKSFMLNSTITDANFIGIKVGDVNDSVTPTYLDGVENRAQKIYGLQTEAATLQAGEIRTVPIWINQPEQLLALQFTLEANPAFLELIEAEAGNLSGVSAANFGLNQLAEGRLTASWFRSEQPSEDNILIHLKVRAKKAIRLEEALRITSVITSAEAYVETGFGVQQQQPTLQFTQSKVDAFQLHQNIPNPFQGETVIGFDLPKASAATLTIYTTSGMVVKVVQGDYAGGYNQIHLNSKDLGGTGVFYYRLETATDAGTRKLIIVE